MRWGCPWGSSWGSGSCPACTPRVLDNREPKLPVAIPPGPSIGSVADVDRLIGAVSQVPGSWYFGSVVAGTPTVDDC